MSKSKLRTKKELLASFIKANKVRRIVLANRAGFDTPEEYREHLEKGVEKDDIAPVIHNVHILDTSISMGDLKQSKLANAIKGMKGEWAELALDNNITYTNTLVTFHYPENIKEEFWKVRFMDIPNNPVTNSWGNTALLDALGHTLIKLKSELNDTDRVLVKIFTDGGENSSRKHSINSINTLINECKDLGMTITFVGTEHDVRNVERLLDVDSTNTLVHNNTMKGVMDSFTMNTMSTKSYASKVARGASKEETLIGFYKQEGTL